MVYLVYCICIIKYDIKIAKMRKKSLNVQKKTKKKKKIVHSIFYTYTIINNDKNVQWKNIICVL